MKKNEVKAAKLVEDLLDREPDLGASAEASSAHELFNPFGDSVGLPVETFVSQIDGEEFGSDYSRKINPIIQMAKSVLGPNIDVINDDLQLCNDDGSESQPNLNKIKRACKEWSDDESDAGGVHTYSRDGSAFALIDCRERGFTTVFVKVSPPIT